MFPPDYRPFIDPVDAFVGFGWGVFLPPLFFAAGLVYHTLRCEEEPALSKVARKAWWTMVTLLAVFVAAALGLWLG